MFRGQHKRDWGETADKARSARSRRPEKRVADPPGKLSEALEGDIVRLVASERHERWTLWIAWQSGNDTFVRRLTRRHPQHGIPKGMGEPFPLSAERECELVRKVRP